MARVSPFLDEYVDHLPADVVVVGAGMSGLQFAKDVSRHANVVTLEAGRNLGTKHIYWDTDSYSAQKQWQSPNEDISFNRPWVACTPPHYSGTSGLRQRLGGRSLYWHGVVLRMDAWALSPEWWPSAIIDELPSLYANQELECLLEPAQQGASHLASLLQAAGFDTAQPAPLAVHFERSKSEHVRWAAYSPLTLWTQELPDLPPIICNTAIISLLTENGKVRGLRILNKLSRTISTVPCTSVVLAAGTIENSRLAAEALYRENCLPSPELWGLTDHLAAGCMFRLELDVDAPSWLESEIASMALVPATESTHSNFFVAITPHPSNRKLVFIDVWGMGEQLPQHENVVRFDMDSREVRVTANYSGEDMRALSQQQSIVADIAGRISAAFGKPAAIIPPSDISQVGTVSEAYASLASKPDESTAPVWYLSPLGSVDHEGCTLPFGRALADTGEVLGIQGLYAVGPCTFPRLGAANPSLTTLALAKRTAQHFR